MMALSDLNFAKGFGDGMNTGLTLLQHVDNKKQREIQNKRAEEEWQWRRGDRDYLESHTRPMQQRKDDVWLEDAELGLDDKRGQVAYNKQSRPMQLRDLAGRIDHAEKSRPLELQGKRMGLQSLAGQMQRADDKHGHWKSRQPAVDQQHDQAFQQNYQIRGNQEQRAQQNQDWQKTKQGWAKEDRPQQQAMKRWQFGQMKSQESRAKGQDRRQEQAHNIKLAQQQYTAAMQAYESGDVDQAVNLMMEADDKSGGLFGNFVGGVHGKMATMAREVSTGKRDINDPEFVAASREFTRPSMRTSGRDPDYEFDGIAMGQDGQVAYAMRPKSMDAIVGRMIQLESSGKPKAKNDRSSATGLGQFVDGTWLDMVKRHKPELAKKHNDAALLKMRTDPKLAREMTTRYAEGNAKQLEANGVKPDAATIYLAHHFGIGGKREAGAVQLLQADPNTPVNQILPPRAIKANPYLKDKTAGELVRGIQQKMSVPATHGLSGDDDDPLVIKDQKDMISEVQHGAMMEQQFMQGTPEPLLNALKQRLAGMGVDTRQKKGKSVKQWNKLDDGTLYNEITGETKRVGAGGGQGGGDLSAKYEMFAENPTGYISEQVGTRLNHLSEKEQMQLIESMRSEEMGDLSQVDGVIRQHEFKRDSQDLADTLTRGVEGKLRGTELGRAYQQLASRARQIGADESELAEIARDSLEAVGDEDQGALLEFIGKHITSLEQHKKAQAHRAEQVKNRGFVSYKEGY